jgi:hypothetical protein
MTNLIESITNNPIADSIHDWHYEAMAWLEDHGVPVILTEDLYHVDRAWYGILYANKCGDLNPIKELANCFDMFGGPRGTWHELTAEIETNRGDY